MLIAAFQKCFHRNPQDVTEPDIKKKNEVSFSSYK